VQVQAHRFQIYYWITMHQLVVLTVILHLIVIIADSKRVFTNSLSRKLGSYAVDGAGSVLVATVGFKSHKATSILNTILSQSDLVREGVQLIDMGGVAWPSAIGTGIVVGYVSALDAMTDTVDLDNTLSALCVPSTTARNTKKLVFIMLEDGIFSSREVAEATIERTLARLTPQHRYQVHTARCGYIYLHLAYVYCTYAQIRSAYTCSGAVRMLHKSKRTCGGQSKAVPLGAMG
jgi:hypothetical protein